MGCVGGASAVSNSAFILTVSWEKMQIGLIKSKSQRNSYYVNTAEPFNSCLCASACVRVRMLESSFHNPTGGPLLTHFTSNTNEG